MKKIIGIILAMLMVFSMSTMAFAGYEATPTPTKEYVQVDASLEVVTAIDELASFNDSTVEPIKGRIFKVKFTIANETEKVIYADKILAKFGISIVDSVTKDTVKLYTEAEDYGFDKIPAKVTIDPNDAPELLTYTIYAITDKPVAIRVTHEEKAYDLEKDATNGIVTFYFVDKAEETTTTTSEAITETTTTTVPAVDEETGGYDEPDYDYDYEVPEVDEEIPNTGSSKAVSGFIALGVIAAGALMLVKKRKSNEENWT